MHVNLILSTAKRVMLQLFHDRRSLALILLVPTMLIAILNFVFYENSRMFDSVAPLLVGLVPFTIMFIITSVAMLRERTSGTLERLIVSPLSKIDLLVGYGLAFAFFAFLQSSLASIVTLYVLDVPIAGDVASLIFIAVLSGVTGMSLGLFFSAFARNEFQAVQFMPAFVLPQFLICGLFIPREQMLDGLYYLSNVMPLSYVVESMKLVQENAAWTFDLTRDISILAGFTILSLILGAISLRAD